MSKVVSVFSHPEFDSHERVVFHHDPESDLQAIIAIHNRNLGPALGGCRMWPYRSDAEALTDVLRLSRGMTYKSALAGLPLGGGKSVIIGDPRKDKTPESMRAMGRFIDSLGGHYIAAEDSGTGVEDLKLMGEETPHVCGIQEKHTSHGDRSGDPSPATAYGTFLGIKAAAEYAFDRSDLEGLKVAVQGVGHVGHDLVRRLKNVGAELWISDLYEQTCREVAEELGVEPVGVEEIIELDVDVFAPCAMGGIVNDSTIPRLNARIVAGSANNQLARPEHAQALRDRGILYAPDYVINAGGIIDVHYERAGHDPERLDRHIETIYTNLKEIFERSDRENTTTASVADRMAEERFTSVA